MAEGEFQRSVASFRRQGSSGLVWDDKFLSGLGFQDQNQQEGNQRVELGTEQKQTESLASTAMLERSRSAGAGARPYRTVNVAPPSKEPPSPKVTTCGFCGFFGKPVAGTRKSNPKSKKRR